MKRIIIFVFLFAGTLVYAGNITQKITFNLANLHNEKLADHDLIYLDDCELTNEIGAPQLPEKALYFSLPQNAKVTKVEVVGKNSIELDNQYDVTPAQPPAILLKDYPIKQVQPNPTIYSTFEPYPAAIFKFIGQGKFDGKNAAMIMIYPLQYIPKLKQLKFHTEITISLDYDSGNLKAGDNLGLINFNELANPQSFDQNSNFEYLVITNSAMDTVFQRLCNWKTKKGIKAATRTVSWITANYAGRDNPEKIRNYLKTLYPDSGLVWLLLGGDVDVVPDREAFAMTCSAHIYQREDSLPCDLYYSDLDRTWDFNNNNVFGEVADSVDLFPDIYVGRAPVNNVSQARAFVNKILAYETNPPVDYQNRALFMGEILWTNPYTDASVGKDYIDSMYVPARFDPITKLYERLGNEDPNSVRTAINQGMNLMNHNGHGNITVMGVGGGYFYNSDMDNLTNGSRQGILYSIGCWTTAFDYDAIAEHFVRNPNGGGVAFIGNSSYGWGSPGNPRFGYSDRFDQQFYTEAFNNPAPHIGQVLALAKAHFVAHSRDANVFRWHQYQLNLIGEPEMMINTDSLKQLLVFHPDAVPAGPNRIVITVTDNGVPIRNALVCVQKGNEVYERGYTGIDGQITLDINPATSGNLALTVTGHNFLPYQTEIPIITGPYVSYLSTVINDSAGNNDHIPNPGETVGYSLLFKNEGNVAANNLTAKLTYNGSELTILDSLASIGNLNPEESVWVNNGFQFYVNNNLHNGTVIRFNLTINDNQADTWIYQPSIVISTPIIKLTSHSFTDSAPGGNNNRVLEPGETVELRLLVKNQGQGIAYNTNANISTNDPNLTILNPNTSFGDIPPDSNAVSQVPLEIRIESGCPPTHIGPVITQITSPGYTFTDTILLFVGLTGLAEDFENSGVGWTHGGSNDLWHITNHNYHSPDNSFYCGDGSYHYQNNMNCYLLSPQFILQPNSYLTFWRKFDVPIYGEDGLYAIVVSNPPEADSDTLDFIGTGGDLGKGNDAIPGSWLQERYSLHSYLPGETLQIRFVFISDNDNNVSEGFYVDDVQVSSEVALDENLTLLSPKQAYLSPGYPNPFTNRTTIYYNLPNTGQVNMKIYNRAGRLVRNLLNETKNPGYYYTIWDGKDNSSRKLSSGIYFLTLTVQNGFSTITLRRKMILLK
jgi:Peptidase family C25/Propeptide_C25/FlgD Ig-like domain